MRIIKFVSKLIFTFSFTGGLYLLIETLYRWHTALEMYYLAGFLGLFALLFNNFKWVTYEMDFLLQCSILTVVATFAEGLVGNIWNVNYTIWDYRHLPLSFWNSQINIIFCLAWFALFFICVPILDYIEWKLFKYKPDIPPYYKVFNKVIFRFNGD